MIFVCPMQPESRNSIRPRWEGTLAQAKEEGTGARTPGISVLTFVSGTGQTLLVFAGELLGLEVPFWCAFTCMLNALETASLYAPP